MTQPPMIFPEAPPPADPAARRAFATPIARTRPRSSSASWPRPSCRPRTLDRIAARARDLVHKVRAARLGQGGLDAFLHEYELSSREGVVLMCLAEALLRIPDAETANLLINDKLAAADWGRHLGSSESLFVNASTWALMLTGRVISLDQEGRGSRRRAAPAGGAQRRAGHPPGRDPGDAHPGPPVRHGPHHRRGAGARAGQGETRLSLFLRHAGRGGAHARGCGALRPRLSRRDRGHRPRRRRAAARSRGRASRSSSRRCIRATNSPSASG